MHKITVTIAVAIASSGNLYLWDPAGDSPNLHTVEAKHRQFGFVVDNQSYINIKGVQLAACNISGINSNNVHVDKITDRYLSQFTNTGSGLMASGTVQGFAIAGADQRFHWADAAIQGDAVEVSSTEVPEPVAVRYAWGDSPICNLYNKEGLPASPFRTDDWPGITGP